MRAGGHDRSRRPGRVSAGEGMDGWGDVKNLMPVSLPTTGDVPVTRPRSGRSASAGDPDVVDLDLDKIVGAAIHRLEADVDPTGPRIGSIDDRGCPPPAVDVDWSAVRRRTLPACVPSERSMMAWRPVGRARARVVREHVREGQPLAGRGRERRSPASGPSSGRRGRWRWPMCRPRAPVTSAIEPGRRRPLSCFAPPSSRSLPGCREPTGPRRGAVSVPSGFDVQPRPTSKSSSKAPQRADPDGPPEHSERARGLLHQGQDRFPVPARLRRRSAKSS